VKIGSHTYERGRDHGWVQQCEVGTIGVPPESWPLLAEQDE